VKNILFDLLSSFQHLSVKVVMCTTAYEAIDPGPIFGIDYLEAYYCGAWEDHHILYILFLLILMAGLIYTLGHTASNYLSPTLAKVCESLNLSYNVAGVTFLAFGNGAPDVFTQVTSFTAENGLDRTALIGINTMLGSSMFVVTMVVGTVAILSPCQVASKIYLRDVSFFIIAITMIVFVGFFGKLTLSGGIFLFVVYFSYVAVVLIVAEKDAKAASAALSNSNSNSNGSVVPKRMGELQNDGDLVIRSLGSDLQTAFWHKSEIKISTSGNGNQEKQIQSTGAGSSSSAMNTKGDSSSGSAYTFLVLNDSESESDSDADIDEEKGTGKNNSNSNSNSNSRVVDDGTITLSGGLISGSFEGEIEDDYVGTIMTQKEIERRQIGVSYNSRSGTDTDNNGSLQTFSSPKGLTGDYIYTKSPLTTGLLDGGGGDDDDDDEETIAFGESRSSITSTDKAENHIQAAGQGQGGEREGGGEEDETIEADRASIHSQQLDARSSATITEALYHQQRFLENRIRKAYQTTDFQSLSPPMKVLACIKIPIDFIRDITIPTLQQESWYRPYAIAHPIMIGLVVKWGFTDWSFGSLFITILIACVPSGLIYLNTHKSKPPSNSSLAVIWVLTAFAMCILWFYLLCGELLCILESIGQIMSIPSSYLALTLLAWGNCIGDFFSIMAIAKRGLGEMAIAGCYASPVFDILFGLGLATSSATLKIYPEPFYITLNPSAYISLAFLYFTLMSSVLIISRRGWRLEKGFGYFLYGVYGIYTLVQLSNAAS
jgi:Ca2+/Na+ antiporter